jgi:NAD(P)-dependent dehydrogenase (short-subunit alcohol dehydrogenase family)
VADHRCWIAGWALTSQRPHWPLAILVVATGRDAARSGSRRWTHDSLIALKLDVTRLEDAEAAVKASVAKFGRIDVLVNNAGNFFAGFFEELSPDQVRNQIETLLLAR